MMGNQKEKPKSEKKDSFLKNPTFYAAFLAFIVSSFGLYQQYVFREDDKELAFKSEIMQERKQALLQALQVIDHSYENMRPEKFNQYYKPHPWKTQEARDAMNKMMLYCEDPQTTIKVFIQTLGAYNPSIDSSRSITYYGIQNFRRQVAIELHLTPINYTDSSMVWIAHLAGSE